MNKITQQLVLLVFYLFSFQTITAQTTLYWTGLGGDNNWTNAGNWSTTDPTSSVTASLSPPSAANDVVFNAGSFPNTQAYVITLGSAVQAKSLLFVDKGQATAVTFNGNGALSLFGGIQLPVVATGVNYNHSGGITFKATTTGNSLDFADQNINSDVTFDGNGGAWVFDSDLTTRSNKSLSVTRGTVDFNDKNFDIHWSFSSTGGTDRSLLFGNSTFTIHQRFWLITGDFGQLTGTPTVTMARTINTIFRHQLPGTSVHNFNYAEVNAPNAPTLTVGNSGNVTINTFNAKGIVLESGTIKRIKIGTANLQYGFTSNLLRNFLEVDQLNFTGSSCEMHTMTGVSPTGKIDFTTAPTAPFERLRLRGVEAHVNGVAASPAIVVNNGRDDGNNHNFVINTSTSNRDLFWIGNSGNWFTVSNWSLTSGGTPLIDGVDCPPTLNDNVFFDANSFNADGQTLSLSGTSTATCNNMTWNGLDQVDIDWAGNQHINIGGDLTLDVNMRDTISYNRTIFLLDAVDGQLDFKNGADSRSMANTLFQIESNAQINQISDKVYIRGLRMGRDNGRLYNVGGNNHEFRIGNLGLQSGGTVNMEDATIVNESNGLAIYYSFNLIFNSNSLWIAEATADFQHRFSSNQFPRFIQTNPGVTMTVNAQFNVTGDATINGQLVVNDHTNVTGTLELSDDTHTFLSGKTVTVGVLDAEGNNCGSAPVIRSNNGAQFDLNSPNNQTDTKLNFATISDINYTGDTNPLDLDGQGAVDGGNNNNITIGSIAPQTYYWRPNPDDNSYTGNWGNPKYWALNKSADFGQANAGGCVPTAKDSIVFDNKSGSGAAMQVILSDTRSVRAIEWVESGADAIPNNMTFRAESGAVLNLTKRIRLANQMNTSINGNTVFNFNSADSLFVNLKNKPFAGRFNFNNGIAVLEDGFTGSAHVRVNNGEFHSNGNTITASNFWVLGSTPKKVDISNSTITLTFPQFTGSSNAPRSSWRVQDGSSVDFTSIGSSIEIRTNFGGNANGGNHFYGAGLTYNNILLTTGDSSQDDVHELNGNNIIEGRLTVESVLHANNSFSVNFLNLKTDRNHVFQIGETTTILPDGNLEKNGDLNAFLNMLSSSNGTLHNFVKASGGNIFVCNINIQDIQATGVPFKTNNVSTYNGLAGASAAPPAGTSWDFTAASTPAEITMTDAADLHHNMGDEVSVGYEITLNNTGPYKIEFSTPTGPVEQDDLSDGDTTNGALVFLASQTTSVEVLDFSYFDCPGGYSTGTMVDNITEVRVPSLLGKSLATSGATETYPFNNVESMVYVMDGADRTNLAAFETRLPQVAIQDGLGDTDTDALGDVTVTTTIDPTHITINPFAFLTRRWNITNTGVDGKARIRLLLTQAELQSLKTAANKTANSDEEFLGSLSLYRYGVGVTPAAGLNFEQQSKLNSGIATEIGATTYFYEAEVSAIQGSYTLGTSIAPGGVASSIKLWIKADADVTTSGSEVSLWKDQSGSGVEFENTGLATGITSGPTLNTNPDALLSYQPVVSFNGTQGLFEGDRNILFPNNLLTIWMVVKGNTGGTVLAHEADLTLPDEGINPEFTIDGNVSQLTTGGATENLSGGLDVSVPSLIVAKRSDTGSFNWELTNYRNGSPVNTSTFTGELEQVLDQMSLGYRHKSDGTAANMLTGDIAELVLYGVVLNTQDDLKVASYLGGKYGITLTHDYVSSDDVVIFDTDGAFASYNNDIILIGKDDQSDLEQRQAKSVNTGTIIRMGLGNIEATNVANTNNFTADYQFLIIGNDGGSINTIPFTTDGNQQRLERIWRASENGSGGDTGATVLEFDLSNSGIIGRTASDFTLYIKNTNEDFTAGATTITPDSFTNGILRFNSVNLAHGDHFTIASSAIAPGAVANNLELWLKADNGVNVSGSKVTQWDNTSNPGSVTAMDLSGTEEVTESTASLNFNNELSFPGGAYFESTEQFIGNNNEYTKFVIYRRTNNATPNALVASAGNDNTQSIHGFYYQPNLGQPNANNLRGFHGSNDGVNGGDYITSPNAADLNTYYIAVLRYGAGGTETNMLRINSEVSAITNTAVESFNDLGTQIGADQGGGLLNNTLTGNIAEVIVYDRALPDTEVQQVESYLAIKYGITIENSYVSGEGSVVYDISNSFDSDIAGIAREDKQSLSQIKSKSINADAILTIGHNDIANPTSLTNDHSFLVWGNNSGNATWVNSSSAPNNFRVLARGWRVYEFGTVGDVKLQFDVEDSEYNVPDILGGNAYYLVYDSNGNNNLGDETPIALTNVTGDIWETATAIDLSNDRLFTLATIFDDTDKDGVANILDLDDDNDGILDTVEVGGNDPLADADGDNIPLYLDDNDSNATIGNTNNAIELGFDTDGDGIPNHLDLDADNDGIPDNIEAQATGSYIAPITTATAEYLTNNGVNNAYLTTNVGGAGLNPVDSDGNTTENLPDYLDADTDDDTIADIVENGSANNSISTFADADNDGIDDLFDTVNNATIWDVNDAVTTGTLNQLQTIYGDLDNDAAPVPTVLTSDLSFRDNCQVVAGAVAGDQSICPGTSPAAFTQTTAAQGDGAVTFQWQSSTTNATTGFSNISGATAATFTSGALAQTTFFKRIDTNTLNGVACSEETNVITITVDDTIDPTGTAPANITVECTADIPAADITAITDEADNCSTTTNIMVTHVGDVSDGNSNPEVITRTYRIADEAGNSIDVTQTITVDDTIDPTGTAPANITVECTADIPAADITAITDEADNCSTTANITVTHVGDVSDGNSNPEVITRTYRIADEAGNSIDVTQTITVDDTIDPTGTAPANVTVECTADIPAADITAITDEADNCSATANITVTHVGDVSDGNSNPEVITRTYRIADEAGNSIDVTQTITVDDTIDPTGTAPANVTVECTADIPAADITAITDEADNCSATANITVTHVGDVSDGNSNPEVITRTYRIADEAGNSIDVTQTITVDDTIDPTGTAPANVTVECTADIPAADITAITDEADNCSATANITVTHVGDVSDGNSNPEVITRTYRIADEAGNSIDVTQTITVDDTIDPTGTAPANVTVECTADIPAADITAITDEADNCSATANIIVTHVGDVSDGNSNPEVITRTYRIADEAGNSIDVTQTITVDDTIDPTGTAPANVTVECTADIPAADITAITDEVDNCSTTANITVTHVGDVSDGNSNPEVITRTYRIADEAGNSIDVTQTITVDDTIDPTGTAPANITVECTADIPAADITAITDEADNCSTTANIMVTHVGDVSDGNSNPEVITRTYRIADEAGNSIDVTQTITVDDTIDPTGTAPANVTVECVADIPAADITEITDEADNCSTTANIMVTHVGDVSDGNSNPEVITRTYRIADEAGNSIDVTQTITVDDTIDPTGTAPANVTVECVADIPAADITEITDEADNCSTTANIMVTHVGDVSDGNSNPEVITRTYRIADEAGNSIDVTQTITVDDTIDPTGTAPANVTVECTADIPAADITEITDEADNCSTTANITVTHVGDVSDGNSNPEVITRTYRIADEAGNSIDVTQTITVDDTIDPTGTAPANVTVECTADIPAADITEITDEADNCSTTANITVTHVGDVSDGNSNPEVITRTYRIADEAGNSIDVTQTITVDDTIDPTGTAPANVTVECIADIPAVDITAITDEADNCSTTANIMITHVGDVSDGNSNPEVITRTYRIVDEAGNSIDVTQTITVDDTIDPTGTAPANVTVECTADIPAADITAITDEADNCSTTANIIVIHVGDVSDGNSNPEVITRTYRIADEAGNSIDVTQTITVDDTIDPTGTAPANVTVECTADIPAADITAITDEADNCSTTANIMVTHVGDVSDGNSNPEVITRTYRIADEAGNSIDVTQTITVDDTIDPTGTAPANVTVECTADIPAADITAITDEADNCSVTANIIVTHVGDVSDGNSNPEVITRTYRIADEAGNSIDVTQTITVDDTIDPIGTAPANVTVECVADIPAADITAITDEADNCSATANIIVTHVGDVSDGNSNPEVITRTYRIADEAGNSIDVTQTITVDDTIDPTGTAPANVTVECVADIPAADITAITDEADNCSTTANIMVTHVGDVSDGNSNPEVITRTYRIADEAGNSIDVTQTITVDDTIDPTGTAPANVTVECTADIPAADITAITDEADNCSATANIIVTHVGDVSDGNSNPEVITRTYRIADEAGNSIDVTQTITVDDTTAPVANNLPTITISCTDTLPTVDTSLINASDNCSSNLVVTHVSDISDGNTRPETITRTYEVVDEAGNSIQVSQLIVINSIEAGMIGNDQVILLNETPNELLSTSTANASGTISYQWQISTTSATNGFNDISGATMEAYSPSAIVEDTWFRRLDTSILNGTICSEFTNTVIIMLDDSLDSDEDGIPDYVDYDDDNDGILDVEEDNGDSNLDTDNDGIVDRLDLDADGDGILDVYESGIDTSNISISSAGSILGAVGLDGVPNNIQLAGTYDSGTISYSMRDSDGDGIHDFQDIDDDNDGALTIDENSDPNNDGNPIDAMDLDEDGIVDYLDTNVSGFNPEDVPNGFSPNGDGDNDVLIIPMLRNYPNFSMEIFNRWGNRVYKYSNNGRRDIQWWDGYSNGSLNINGNELVPSGAYYYVINFNQGNKKSISGWIYVNR